MLRNSRLRNSRRLFIGVGMIGAAAAAVVTGTATVLAGEARLARRKVEARTPINDPPTGNGVWGGGTGEPIVLAIMGDSSAVGLGVDDVTEAPGVLIAAGLSNLSGRPVRLVRVAISGSESKDLDAQITDVLPHDPDVVVIMIGTNDVTARTRVEVAVRQLGDAVRRLRAADVGVVVGTCPDLGTVRPIPQPLRSIARRWSRQLAAAQVVAVVEAGGRTVSLGSALGPVFAQNFEMWSDDGFHPSAAGYAAAASLMLPSVADVLGYWPISREHILTRMQNRARSIESTAQRASAQTGAEVIGQDRARLDGTTSVWGTVRRLLPIPLPAPFRLGEHHPDNNKLGA